MRWVPCVLMMSLSQECAAPQVVSKLDVHGCDALAREAKAEYDQGHYGLAASLAEESAENCRRLLVANYHILTKAYSATGDHKAHGRAFDELLKLEPPEIRDSTPADRVPSERYGVPEPSGREPSP
jgi:hypothetical protein